MAPFRWVFSALVTLTLLAVVHGGPPRLSVHARPLAAGSALGTGFTYQGVLDEDGTPVEGSCDFEFGLWDAVSGGTQLGDIETEGTVSVTEGLFTVTLNETGAFGGGAFDGDARWLEITVRCPAGSGSYTTLSPRQSLQSTPYAHWAADAGLLDGRSAPEIVAADRQRPPTDNSREVVDSSSEQLSPYGSGITIGSDGLPVIAYHRAGSFDELMVAKCDDLACSGGDETISSVDKAGGGQPAIAIGTDGLPIIAYHVDTNPDKLRVAHCSDPACSGGDETISILDDINSPTGAFASIAIGSDGLPVISYYSGAALGADLKVAHCNDVKCTGGDETISIVDSAGLVGDLTSIAIGVDGMPVISYRDSALNDLKVAHCDDVACSGSGETISFVDSTSAGILWTSIVIGADTFPVIAYHDYINEDLKVARCNDVKCTGGDETITTVDSAGDVGDYPSITIGTDGFPIVSYLDSTNSDVKVVHCNDPACSGADETPFVIAGEGFNVAGGTTITIGIDGLPIVAYRDSTNKDLKLTRCANPFCVPYLRRR